MHMLSISDKEVRNSGAANDHIHKKGDLSIETTDPGYQSAVS